MAVQIFISSSGDSLPEALTAFIATFTGSFAGIPQQSMTNESISGNPVSEFSRIYRFTFDSGEQINQVGIHNFIASFIDLYEGGATLANPLDSLSRQLPLDGNYGTFTFEYEDGL